MRILSFSKGFIIFLFLHTIHSSCINVLLQLQIETNDLMISSLLNWDSIISHNASFSTSIMFVMLPQLANTPNSYILVHPYVGTS